jgi:ribonuclease HII
MSGVCATGDEVEALALDEIRARLDSDLAPRQETRLLAALRRDPRRGARALAQRLEQRRSARRREARRLASLFRLRRTLFAAGARSVAGVDEVGVGPLAGPVVAAAVILPVRLRLPGLDDSKRLSPRERERLDAAIRAQALAVCLAEVPAPEVDRRGILRATLLAMRQAVAGLALRPDHVLVDARTIPDLECPQTPLVGGDARDGSIAAASIVAKVHRDALMRRLDARFPGYGFAKHMGYGTREHLRALDALGPCAVHRRSFAPVAQQALFS